MVHTPYSNLPNFISPKVVQQTIRQIFLPLKFPSKQHTNNYSIVSLNSCKLYVRNIMKPIFGSQNFLCQKLFVVSTCLCIIKIKIIINKIKRSSWSVLAITFSQQAFNLSCNHYLLEKHNQVDLYTVQAVEARHSSTKFIVQLTNLYNN